MERLALESTGFGWLIANGTRYDHDLIITADARLLPRPKHLSKKYGGWHTVLGPEEPLAPHCVGAVQVSRMRLQMRLRFCSSAAGDSICCLFATLAPPARADVKRVRSRHRAVSESKPRPRPPRSPGTNNW